MDRAVAAVRLPPVARTLCLVVCAVVTGVLPAAPADAWALAPPPVRLAAVWGCPSWSVPAAVWLAPQPGRWGGVWAPPDTPVLSHLPRSLHGRA